MRKIVIGDIHGCYRELKELIATLKREGEYNKDTDKLIFLGDYIDRGKDSRLVIEFIRGLQKDNDNVIALMGNHEDMLLDWDKNRDGLWILNGGQETLKSYKGYKEQFEKDIEWIRNLPVYHEDDDFVYVHAGVDVTEVMEKQDRHTLLWIREPFIYYPKEYYKRVIFGHTPTAFLTEDTKPVRTFANNVAIDTGCVYGGALTALIIDDDEVDGFYQVVKSEETEEISM